MELNAKILKLILIISFFVLFYKIQLNFLLGRCKLSNVADIYQNGLMPNINLTALELWQDYNWIVNPTRNTLNTHRHFINGRIHNLNTLKNKKIYSKKLNRLKHILAPKNNPIYHTDVKSLECFAVNSIWPKKYLLIREAVAIINETLWRGNISYFISHGSFLGSYRFHSVIPWDDDIDFQVHHFQKDEVIILMNQMIIKNAGRHRMLFKDLEKVNGGHMKLGLFCTQKANQTLTKSCKLDIDFFFFDIYGDNNKIEIAENPKELDFNTFFPVRLRPFMGLLLPMPSNYSKFREEMIDYDYRRHLREDFNYTNTEYVSEIAESTESNDFCVPAYRQNSNISCTNVTIQCNDLSPMYPKMFRKKFNSLKPIFEHSKDDKILQNYSVQVIAEITMYGNILLSYFLQIIIN